jgi:hypothetical protein
MSPQRQGAAHAIRSVRMLVVLLLIVVVIGFAAAGYEINHQRSEVAGLKNQVNGLNSQVQDLDAKTVVLGTALKAELAQK